MGIFNRIKQMRSKIRASEETESKEKKTAEEAKPSPGLIVAPKAKAARFSATLVSPRISEKAAILASKGTYVFNVPVNANKVEIGKAVEALYKVSVASVRTVRGKGKVVRRGRIAGVRNRWKKALVTLKRGQKIELYEGV